MILIEYYNDLTPEQLSPEYTGEYVANGWICVTEIAALSAYGEHGEFFKAWTRHSVPRPWVIVDAKDIKAMNDIVPGAVTFFEP